MVSKVNIRFFEPNDITGITKLLVSTFPNWPGYYIESNSKDHWRWKYLDSPYGCIVAVAEVNGKIIGCDHEQFRKIKIGDGYKQCSLGGDSAVSPSYRRQGVFSSLLEIKESKFRELKIELIYSVTTNPIIIRGHLKQNRSAFPAPIIGMIKILDIDRFAERNNISKIMTIGYYLYQKYRKVTRKNAVSSDYKIIEADNFESPFFDFINIIQRDYNWFTERTSRYMRWRFLDKRGGSHKVYYLMYRGDIVGYVILRFSGLKDDIFIEGKIVDLFIYQDHQNAFFMLMEKAEEYFSDQKATHISVLTCRGNLYERNLLRFGYIEKSSKLFMSYKGYNEVICEDVFQFKNSSRDRLQMTYSDLDL